MKYKIRLLLIAFSAVLLFNSCSNELDVVDDYKEIPIVYGLINRSAKVNYVRLQRAYLGAGNALVMAQNPDSIYYDTSIVDLKVISLKNGIEKDVYTLQPVSSVKDEGLFTDADHLLYRLVMLKTNGDTALPDPAFEYQLRFQNKATGKIVTANTSIVGSINPINYAAGTTFLKINLASEKPFHITFLTSKNARIYGMIFRFVYTETNNTTQVATEKSVDYYIDNILSRTLNEGTELEFLLEGQKIFQYIGSKVKEDPTVTRSAFSVHANFVFTAGTDLLYNYVQVNQPANTVNYIPEFTNLSEGKGVFTSRTDTTITNIPFSDLTIDSLLNGSYTKHIFGN